MGGYLSISEMYMQAPHEQPLENWEIMDIPMAVIPEIDFFDLPDLSEPAEIIAWSASIESIKATSPQILLDKEKTGAVLLAFVSLLYKKLLECADDGALKIERESLLSVMDNILSLNPAMDLVDESGKTALHYAVLFPGTVWAEKLLEKKADINIRSKEGITPLYQVLHARGSEITNSQMMIGFLLKNGADFNIASKEPLPSFEKSTNDSYFEDGKRFFSMHTIIDSFMHTSAWNFFNVYLNACVTKDAQVWFIIFNYLVHTGYLGVKAWPTEGKMEQYHNHIKLSDTYIAEKSLLQSMTDGLQITTENDALEYFKSLFQSHRQNGHLSYETGLFVLDMDYFLKTEYLDNPGQRWEVLQQNLNDHISKNEQYLSPACDKIVRTKSPMQSKLLFWNNAPQSGCRDQVPPVEGHSVREAAF